MFKAYSQEDADRWDGDVDWIRHRQMLRNVHLDELADCNERLEAMYCEIGGEG